MPRRFVDRKLVIASHNPGKVREMGELLEGRNIDLISAGDLNIDEPEETGKTFEANAILKAQHSAQASGLPALADDSGLVVHALNGDPGIYSARWGGAENDFAMAMTKVHQALENITDRSAHFACALALAWPDGHTECVLGTVAGHLVWPPRGSHGFGYDPIFVSTGHDLTFGEMNPASKHAISHRADAFQKLLARCFSAPENG